MDMPYLLAECDTKFIYHLQEFIEFFMRYKNWNTPYKNKQNMMFIL